MTAMSRISRRIFLAVALCAAGLAQAQLSIEITGAGANRIPVAIVDFPGDPAASRVITATVRSDLERSGLFKLIDHAGLAFDENAAINHA
ncbi:MAG: Tol-Pal system protein TolB, partial [Azonexus sp.]|nr:Tol-Pal system protein TolB [Azonexus sp.]